MPKVVWLSGLFNPQSFLTAVMQTTARRNDWPLDKTVVLTEVRTSHITALESPVLCVLRPVSLSQYTASSHLSAYWRAPGVLSVRDEQQQLVVVIPALFLPWPHPPMAISILLNTLLLLFPSPPYTGDKETAGPD